MNWLPGLMAGGPHLQLGVCLFSRDAGCWRQRKAGGSRRCRTAPQLFRLPLYLHPPRGLSALPPANLSPPSWSHVGCPTPYITEQKPLTRRPPPPPRPQYTHTHTHTHCYLPLSTPPRPIKPPGAASSTSWYVRLRGRDVGSSPPWESTRQDSAVLMCCECTASARRSTSAGLDIGQSWLPRPGSCPLEASPFFTELLLLLNFFHLPQHY